MLRTSAPLIGALAGNICPAMKIRSVVFVMLFSSPIVVASTATEGASTPGQWSVTASIPKLNSDAATLYAPDGVHAIISRQEGNYVAAAQGVQLGEAFHLNQSAEIEWAPDSSAFVVTQSEGGVVGTWQVTVYELGPNGPMAREVTDSATKQFQRRPAGCTEEQPNIGAAGWINSDTVLLVAEAPPHSSCRDMGTLRGYEVSVTNGKVVQELTTTALHANYGTRLGMRLRDRK